MKFKKPIEQVKEPYPVFASGGFAMTAIIHDGK